MVPITLTNQGTQQSRPTRRNAGTRNYRALSGQQATTNQGTQSRPPRRNAGTTNYRGPSRGRGRGRGGGVHGFGPGGTAFANV
eukprot:SAG31_NODE_10806_length_1094_cov_7.172864_1_plen_83_part_00